MGMMASKGNQWYKLIYAALFVLAIAIALIKDKSPKNLGFSKGHLKADVIISTFLVLITFFLSVFFLSKKSFPELLNLTLYFLFYIAFVEEMIFRSFIQSYLFGLRINEKIIFLLGGVFFSLMHLPFQMYINQDISLSYVLSAAPQLIFCVLFHIFTCFIVYKRNNILIPIALHYVINFLQSI